VLAGSFVTASACGGSSSAGPEPTAPANAQETPTPPPVPSGEPAAGLGASSSSTPSASPVASASTGAAPPADAAAPIPAKAVEGTIFDKPFAGKVALATKTDTPGEYKIWIVDRPVKCDALKMKVNDMSSIKELPTGTVFLRMTVTWKAGETTKLYDYTASSYLNAEQSLASRAAKAGRVELTALPAKPGDKGKLRVDFQSTRNNESARGETTFSVCP
jgi:hypothetical protein